MRRQQLSQRRCSTVYLFLLFASHFLLNHFYNIFLSLEFYDGQTHFCSVGSFSFHSPLHLGNSALKFLIANLDPLKAPQDQLRLSGSVKKLHTKNLGNFPSCSITYADKNLIAIRRIKLVYLISLNLNSKFLVRKYSFSYRKKLQHHGSRKYEQI